VDGEWGQLTACIGPSHAVPLSKKHEIGWMVTAVR
jgi:hypothetical protein